MGIHSTFCKNKSGLSGSPFISVILPVYNGSRYLNESINCILRQRYTNFELIIIDDGSTDDSASIIAAYTDPRIRFYSQENQGLSSALNQGLSLANGIYIARQDQDDVSLPDRFARQVAFLEANPDYGMVGTWAAIWEETKLTDRLHRHDTDNLQLKFDLLFDNPFVHSSMMIRKDVFNTVGVYCTDKNRQPPEDYELWSRIAREYRIANIPEVLHIYREMPKSMSRSGDNPFLKHLLKINAENLAWATEGSYSNISLEDLAALKHGIYKQFSSKTSLRELISIIQKAGHVLSDQAGVPYDTIHGKVEYNINDLRYHYYQARYYGLLGYSGESVVTRTLHLCRKLIRR
jgi:glycosyltransferase involved in cell wall biosynthesis